jgi:aldehyde:ferredoxin oxidoreductase
VKSPVQSLALGPQATRANPHQPKDTAAWYDNFTIRDTVREMIATQATNQGMDPVLLTGMLRWAAHLFEQGVIDRRHTRGLDLNRLDDSTLLALTENIALRRNVGRLLGEGPLRAASQFGFKYLPVFAPVSGLLAIYGNGPISASDSMLDHCKAGQSQWQHPKGPGRVPLALLYDLISGCLGIDNLSHLPDLENIQAMIRINTGLRLDEDRLLSIAYRCYALERLYNVAAASRYRKQNETELNLDVPASFRLQEDWDDAETLSNMRTRMARHCKANGWARQALVKKRVFELLGIGDLWAS